MASKDELEGLGLTDETVQKLKLNGIQSKSDLKLLLEDEKAMKEEVGLSFGERLRVKEVVKREFPCSTSDKDEEFDWRDTVRKKLHQMFQYEVTTVLTPVTLFLNTDETLPDWKGFRVILEDDCAFRDYAKKLADDVKNGRRSLKKIDDTYSIGVGALLAYGFAGMARAWGKLPAEVQEKFLELANQNLVLRKLSDGVNAIGGERLFAWWNMIHGGYQTWKNVRKFKNGEIDGITCANNIVKVWLTTLGGWVGGVAGATAGAVVAGPVGALVGGAAGAMVGAYLAGKLAEMLIENLFSGSYREALKKARKVLEVPEQCTMKSVQKEYGRAINRIMHDRSLDRIQKATDNLKADTAYALLESSFTDGA